MKKILIIDDEEKFGLMVKRNLERTGHYEVRVETHGAEGLEAARDYRPNIVLLDMMIPDLRGPEVAWQLRTDKRLRRTPIIFLTAVVGRKQTHTFAGLVGGGWPFRARPCVAKPVRTRDLIDAIEQNLWRKRVFMLKPICATCHRKVESVNDAWVEFPEPLPSEDSEILEKGVLNHFDCHYADDLRIS
ncbi:MAG: response regulator [Candidatus Omnitrophota bacterium]|nr:response regulator [Candidatus Omnitrophota bacterium]